MNLRGAGVMFARVLARRGACLLTKRFWTTSGVRHTSLSIWTYAAVASASQERLQRDSYQFIFGLAAAGLLFGASTAHCASNDGSDGGRECDGDFESDERGSEDECEVAYQRNLEHARRRRAAQRHGDNPTATSLRRKTNVEQHDAEMDANALLKAIEFTCDCEVAQCIKPSSDFIKTCRQLKFENQRGKWLAQMVRQAVVVDQSGQRYFDDETSTIHIGNGHVACWRRFNSIFDVKPRMQTAIRSWALASDEQHSIWNSDVVPVSSVFDFDAFYHDNMEILEGFGAACEATAAPGEQPRMDEERYSHFRFALITKDSNSGMASIRFAEDCFSAKRGEFFPAPRDAGADPLAPLDYCTLDKRGAPVLKALPEGEPTRVQYWPGHWKYHENFTETLSALGQSVQWPSAARQAWADYIQEPPCKLGVPWDPESLAQPPSAQSAAPRFDSIASRRLVMCPLVTGTRTRVMKRNEQAGVLGLRRGRFNVAFEDLEVGDMAFALAWPHAPHAFRPFVRGKQTMPIELLEIMGITSKPKKEVGWRYWQFRGRANGTYHFVPLMEGGKRKEMWHPYQDPTKPGQSEMLIVWHDDVDERRLVDDVYTLGIQQLHDLHTWCGPCCCFSHRCLLTQRSLLGEEIGHIDDGNPSSSDRDDEIPLRADARTGSRKKRRHGPAAGGAGRAAAAPSTNGGGAPREARRRSMRTVVRHHGVE